MKAYEDVLSNSFMGWTVEGVVDQWIVLLQFF